MSQPNHSKNRGGDGCGRSIMDRLQLALDAVEDARVRLEEANEAGDLEDRLEAAQDLADAERRLKVARLRENE